MYDANDLLQLSVITITAYICSLGKKFYCKCLKTTWYEMILSYVKPFNEKMP